MSPGLQEMSRLLIPSEGFNIELLSLDPRKPKQAAKRGMLIIHEEVTRGPRSSARRGADIKNFFFFFFCSLINAAIIGVWGTVVSRSVQAGMAHFLCDWDICRGVLCKKKME